MKKMMKEQLLLLSLLELAEYHLQQRKTRGPQEQRLFWRKLSFLNFQRPVQLVWQLEAEEQKKKISLAAQERLNWNENHQESVREDVFQFHAVEIQI